MYDLIVYLEGGIYKLKDCIPIALCVYFIWLFITFLFSRESARNIPLQVSRLLWVVWFVLLLDIKGMIDLDSSNDMTNVGEYATTFNFELFSPNGLDERHIGIMDFLNVLLYIPFGYLTTAAFDFLKKSFLHSVIFAIIIALTLESYQCILGRNAQLDDVITNILGFIIGRIGFFAIRNVWDNLYCKGIATSTNR